MNAPTIKTSKIFLSRRNLLALMSKLDRQERGEVTQCCIIKHQNNTPAYRQTMKHCAVYAVEDGEYYGAQNRPAGEMHPADEANLPKPTQGIIGDCDPFEFG